MCGDGGTPHHGISDLVWVNHTIEDLQTLERNGSDIKGRTFSSAVGQQWPSSPSSDLVRIWTGLREVPELPLTFEEARVPRRDTLAS